MFILKLGLLIFFIISTNSNFFQRIDSIGVNFGLLVFLSLWIFIILAIFSITFYSRRNIRIFWGLIFTISSIAGSTFYLSSGGEYFSFNGVASLWDAKGNAGDAFNLYFNILLETSLKAFLGFIGIILPYNTQTTHKKWIYLLPLFPISLIMGILYSKGGEGTDGLPTQVTPISIFTFFIADKALAQDLPPREKLTLNPSNDKTIQNIILVVDESVRADFLDINNKINGVTTGLVNEASVINFGWSTSSTSCSLYSNLALRYGGNEKEILNLIQTKPSIWEYAKNASYETYLIQGQYLSSEDKPWIDYDNIDYVIDKKELVINDNENLIDFEIAKQIKTLINKNKRKKFIYVVKKGSHFPYEKNYPTDKTPYQPHMSKNSIFSPQNTVSESHELVINSYKNVLSWNTGIFFKEYFNDNLKNPTVLFYTSDHGQKLKSEKSKSFFTHCNTTFISPYEGLVPLIISTNDENLFDKFNKSAKTNFDKTSHFNIFPTILWLLGYDETFAKKNYDDLLINKLIGKQQFISPPFFTKFGKKHRWNSIPTRQELKQ